MEPREEISQYDFVEVIRVPEQYVGLMEIGDVGVVVEKLDDTTFEVECIQPGGASKWLERLNIQFVRLRSKDPYHRWVAKSLPEQPIMKTSIILGIQIGATFGGLLGAALGVIARMTNGILIGLLIGLLLGVLTGALTAALTVKTAGRTGGIGVGYFTGMVLGGVLGLIAGALIPPSWWMTARTEDLPTLDAFIMGRFQTAALLGFVLSILATVVGVWVSGRNLIPRNLKERYRS